MRDTLEEDRSRMVDGLFLGSWPLTKKVHIYNADAAGSPAPPP